MGIGLAFDLHTTTLLPLTFSTVLNQFHLLFSKFSLKKTTVGNGMKYITEGFRFADHKSKSDVMLSTFIHA